MTISVGQSIAIIAVCAACTFLERWLPWLLFGHRAVPKVVEYLGKILPMAVMVSLLVYCLRGMRLPRPGVGTAGHRRRRDGRSALVAAQHTAEHRRRHRVLYAARAARLLMPNRASRLGRRFLVALFLHIRYNIGPKKKFLLQRGLPMKHDKKKQWLSIGLLTLGAAALAVFAAATLDAGDVRASLAALLPGWTAAIVGCMLLYYLCDALKYRLITRAFGCAQPLGDSIDVSMIGFFYSAVTPAAAAASRFRCCTCTAAASRPARPRPSSARSTACGTSRS